MLLCGFKGGKMSIGSGVFLIALGAILSFAVAPNLGGGFIDLTLIGYILMGAGALVLVIGLVLLSRKNKTTSTVVEGTDPANNQTVVKRETESNI